MKLVSEKEMIVAGYVISDCVRDELFSYTIFFSNNEARLNRFYVFFKSAVKLC